MVKIIRSLVNLFLLVFATIGGAPVPEVDEGRSHKRVIQSVVAGRIQIENCSKIDHDLTFKKMVRGYDSPQLYRSDAVKRMRDAVGEIRDLMTRLRALERQILKYTGRK
jgi:hypothetical protein